MKQIALRVSETLHAAARLKSVREGQPLEPLLRGWLEEWVVNGGLGAGEPEAGSRSRHDEANERPSGIRDVARSPAPSPSKPCSRQAQHHINHRGSPCKVCGWPNIEEE